MLVFVEGEKRQQQTQPTYGVRQDRTWATFVGGERFHHCAIPGPRRHSGHVAVSTQQDDFSSGRNSFLGDEHYKRDVM